MAANKFKSKRKAHLCLHLLQGRVINIKNGFELFGITNIPREIGRAIERTRKQDGKSNGFGVQVSRDPRTGKTSYGEECCWVDYRLNFVDYNQPGIELMRQYVKEVLGEKAWLKITPSAQKYGQTALQF